MGSEDVVGLVRWLAPRLSLVLGLGFLVANVQVGLQLVAYWRRRRFALLVWEPRKPRFYGLNLGLGVLFGALIAIDVFLLRRPVSQLFGEVMMCAYYGYAFPMSARIARGFYDDGVWADSGFLPWAQISSVSWRDEPTVTLVILSQVRSIARRLSVPGHLYGQVRRFLRDRISSHDLQIFGPGLDLGSRDGRDTV
jgi:hypothetical protein